MTKKNPATLEELAAQYKPRRRVKNAGPAAPAAPKAEPAPAGWEVAETAPEDTPGQSPVATAQAAAAPTDKAAQLAALLAELTAGNAAPVDADTVRQLVREELANAQAAPVQVTAKGPAANYTIAPQSHSMTRKVMSLLTGGENVYLVGPSGSGKTTLAEHCAEALDVAFYATGAVSEPFGLLGYNDINGNCVHTSFRKAWENGGVFLFDEMDASGDDALTCFNMALANGVCAFPDGMVSRHKDFYCIGGGNTKGTGPDDLYSSRNKLDAAFLERFVTLFIDYDLNVEANMAKAAAVQFDLPVEFGEAVADSMQDYRRRAVAAGQRHLITPRSTVRLVKMAAMGFSLPEALAATVYLHAGEDATRQEGFALRGTSWPEDGIL